MSFAPRDMDGFLPLLATADTKTKLTLGTNLINYLTDPSNSIECSDIGQFVDSLIPWMQSSNYKVSQNGLDVMTALVDRMAVDFRPYIQTVLPAIIDRLGDNKDLVRERCQLLILKLYEREALSPQQLFDRMLPAFSHKNSNVREEVMHCLVATLNEHGSQSLSISKLLPSLVKLLSDSNGSVRETAFNTLASVYRHVGERLRTDLQRKYQVPPAKMQILMSRFDEIKASGDLMPTASTGENGGGFLEEDEPDRIVRTGSSVKRAISVPASRRNVLSATKSIPSTPAQSYCGSTTKLVRTGSLRKPSSAVSGGQAGAVDEEWFLHAFEDVPTLQLFSGREVDDHMTKIRETVADPNQDWNKRVDALKKLRSLLLAGASSFDELHVQLRLLEPAMQTSIKDLRSQVVREACVSVAFLSQQLGQRCDHFAEAVLPALINLIQNSAKVIASAGLVTIRFILQCTHYPRLLPIITLHTASKSKDIRRACTEFLEQVLHTWSTHALERHIPGLQEAVKRGISDADPAARMSSRKAYWGFKEHFPQQAEALLNSLDASYKRALYGELSSSSSSNSLHITSSAALATPMNRRTHKPDGSTTPRRGLTASGSGLRSNSAIDLHAAQRAKARAQYSALARQQVGSGASLPRPRKPLDSGPGSLGAVVSPTERSSRTRSRVAGVSQSQPSSRSGSPSCRLNYSTYREPYGDSCGRKSIPRSTGTSRETSPNRFNSLSNFGSKLRSRGHSDRPPIQPTSQPVMAQKILQASREAESALADVLGFEPSSEPLSRVTTRKGSYRPMEDHSDESETSSVCSERSYDSYRRPSDSFSWSGSQQRLYRDIWEPATKDITEMIANCESTHWSDRKEGLVGLQLYLQGGNALTATELKRITDNFTKMFMDSHTKVFSLFLDTLNELIVSHRADLNSWLYVLLTRLLNKLGADLLGSIQTKIYKSLDVVRESFPCELQMASVLRFLVDATQTPNARVKTAALSYITKLAAITDPSLAFPPPSPGQLKDTVTAALTKMIGWTMGDSIKQGVELRRAAQDAIIALFNLNTPQVTLRFAQLPKEYQEAAANLIQGRMRRSSGGGDCLSPPSPILRQLPSSRYQTFAFHPDTENLNPEEISRSLRRTTAEIQNYSFESGSGGKVLERDTTSQDSGISQMSACGGDRTMDTLKEQMEDLALEHRSSRSSSLVSPTSRNLAPRDCNGMDTQDNPSSDIDNGFHSADGAQPDESEAMRKLVERLQPATMDTDNGERLNNGLTSEADKTAALSQLARLVRECSSVTITEHFKVLLRVLVSQLAVGEPPVKALVLGALTEMVKKRAMAEAFNSYVELLILKVLQTYHDTSKEVLRIAEICASTIGTLLQPELIIRVLVPLITAGDYPVNLAAIKMLTRLVEARGKHPVTNHLTELMPGLIQAYDNEESSVRKSAVFCMVALHNHVGEASLQPHLAALNGSKLKLLHLYIKRAQHGPSSPKAATLS